MDKKDIALIVAFKAKLDAEYADSLLNKNPFVPIFCQTRRTRELFYCSVNKTYIEYASNADKDIQRSNWARFLNSFQHCVHCESLGLKSAYYHFYNIPEKNRMFTHSCSRLQYGVKRSKIYEDYKINYWIPKLLLRNIFPANVVSVQVISISRDSTRYIFNWYTQNWNNLFNFVFINVHITNMVNYKILQNI